MSTGCGSFRKEPTPALVLFCHLPPLQCNIHTPVSTSAFQQLLHRSSVRNAQDKGFLSSRDEVVLIMSAQTSNRSDDGSNEDDREQVDCDEDADEQVAEE